MTIKLLKYSQLANGLGVAQATINVAVSREYLIPTVVDGKKMIDITNPHNKLWLKQQEEAGKILDMNSVFKKPKEIERTAKLKIPKVQKETPEADQDLETLKDDLREVQLRTKKATLEKMLRTIKLDDIKIAKQMGQLIPFDAVKSFFLYTVEGLIKSFDQETKSISDVILSRFGATREEHIEVKKEISAKLNEIKHDAISDLTIGLDQIVEEYQEVRGRGESK